MNTLDPDRLIHTVAARQHGLVTRAQLVAAGLSLSVVEYRVRKQRLEAVHRGVYRVGPVRSAFEREMAAVLACGATAYLSHASAGVLHEIMTRVKGTAPMHVSTQIGNRAPAAGIVVHRVATMHDEEKAQLHGIPVTSVERTLLDLGSQLDEPALERAFAVAERRALVDVRKLQRLIELRPYRRGVAKWRRLLAAAAPLLTRSEAESRFLALIRRADLATPEANVKVRGCEVDFLWRAERLVVEIDGFAYHSSAAAFERDRQRDALLTAAGLRVMRATWRQIAERPEALVVRVAQALARADRP